MKIDNKFSVAIDNREQLPVLFDKVGSKNFEYLQSVEFKTLKTGDYSLIGLESEIAIERKSIEDLFLSCGRNRDRFEREFQRMSYYKYAALLIESDFKTIFEDPPGTSNMLPKSVFRTLIAWSQRYNVHIFPCPTRAFMEKTIYILLHRYHVDSQKIKFI